MTPIQCFIVIVNFFEFFFKSIDIMNTIINYIPIVIAAIVIVIISKGMPDKPIIPKIKNAAKKLGTTPIKDIATFLNKTINIKKIPNITIPNVSI